MRKAALPFTNFARLSIPVSDVEPYAEEWLTDCEYRQHSKTTLANRRLYTEKLVWFLQTHGHTTCGTAELRAFLAYVTNGHEKKGGRWGNAQQTKKARPSTVATYHRHLSTFFNFLVEEGHLDASPMQNLRPPVVRSDQIVPFTSDQVEALLSAAKKTHQPQRDRAILLLLLDTGLRASELCSLKVRDVEFGEMRCIIRGKGNKSRAVHFGPTTRKALVAYVSAGAGRSQEEYLFLSHRGSCDGEVLTRYGIRQLIMRLAKSAALKGVRSSPHTLRHTFAVNFLRNGGDVFTLKELLGHTSLSMTNRYVSLARADLANQHRRNSPVESIVRHRKEEQ